MKRLLSSTMMAAGLAAAGAALAGPYGHGYGYGYGGAGPCAGGNPPAATAPCGYGPGGGYGPGPGYGRSDGGGCGAYGAYGGGSGMRGGGAGGGMRGGMRGGGFGVGPGVGPMFGPMFGPQAEEMKSQLNLTPEQEAKWGAVVVEQQQLRDSMFAGRDAMHEAMRQELAKPEPDLGQIATLMDGRHEAMDAARKKVRDAWIELYNSFTAEQKAVVRNAANERWQGGAGPMGPRGWRRG